jgi:hypothetical protein
LYCNFLLLLYTKWLKLVNNVLCISDMLVLRWEDKITIYIKFVLCFHCIYVHMNKCLYDAYLHPIFY